MSLKYWWASNQKLRSSIPTLTMEMYADINTYFYIFLLIKFLSNFSFDSKNIYCMINFQKNVGGKPQSEWFVIHFNQKALMIVLNNVITKPSACA